MSAILGISAFYHDAAAALIVDGRVVAAAQEERFTRKKHDPDFPARAVAYCLAEAGLSAADLDWVGFYDKPLLKFERLLETYFAFAPAGFRSFLNALPAWVQTRLFLNRELARALGDYRKRFVYTEHHESHAASAFYPSPFDEAAILTVDGVGEWTTASFGVGRGNRVELSHQIRFPHSLGLLYSAFTYYTGFRVNSGEYKVMGLAPYGEPKYAKLIHDHLIDLKDDGSFRMDMSYFNYAQGFTMTSPKFHRLFGGPPRKPETPLTRREMDLAASVQVVTEEVLLRMARHVHAQTGQKNLCLAGGVALNCVANGRILREGPFDDLWVQPAAGDAGGALGVALFVHHQLLDQPRTPCPTDAQQGSLLGPSFNDAQIERFLRKVGATFTKYESDEALCEAVAGWMAEGKVVGWFQGRMEFGPRALGARSILGDARNASMQSTMNLKIKFRESFRPFAPSVLREKVADYFETRPHESSPYMLLVAPVRADKRLAINGQADGLMGIDKLKVPRSVIPAVTHVDHSARIQTVDDRDPLYRRLIRTFDRLTGCPVIINTSFNVRGEPIVGTPEDAYRCFRATDIDVLALGHYVLTKADTAGASAAEVAEHLARFQLD
ncbi:MAG TPA: carbamoyltransferase [Isosphaeraceae bacterium]|nr:carbamoyltransferase [Isosphaeraceae bacterium]